MTRIILNVDDYRPSRYARTKVLQQANFTVLEASTGKAALELISEQKPALILLDVNLPDISGFEICRLIKSDPKTKHTPVLHISASSVQSSHQVHGLDAGADSYLVEPVDAGVLIATVKAFLRTSEAEKALRRSNEELAWFSNRVAHDLNEPLRTITAHVEMLGRKFPSEEASQSVKFVLEATRRMGAFIDNLLSYSQVSYVDRESVMLDCEASLNRALITLEEAIVSSSARVTHDPLPTIKSDPALEYVFQNLISNAIKYRRETVAPVIHISACRRGDFWQFSIEDNGIGIEPKYQTEIFKAFRRLHGTSVPGNGLGLALTQRLVERQGGSVWVESTLESGSVFHFLVPCADGEEQPGVGQA
jgi:signal transduction histidine kinase